jgi:hypothetical protein
MILSPINDRIYAHAVESPTRETHENNEDIKTAILLNEQIRKHGKSKHFALTLCKKLPSLLNDQRPRERHNVTLF